MLKKETIYEPSLASIYDDHACISQLAYRTDSFAIDCPLVPTPRARARARRVVPIAELVFGALTQNRSSLEDAPPRPVAIQLRGGAGFRHEKSRQTP